MQPMAAVCVPAKQLPAAHPIHAKVFKQEALLAHLGSIRECQVILQLDQEPESLILLKLQMQRKQDALL
jgi:hypothetical protein